MWGNVFVFVRLSLTLRYCIKTVKHIVEIQGRCIVNKHRSCDKLDCWNEAMGAILMLHVVVKEWEQ